MVGDILLDQYNVADKEDKEMDGPTMKMIVTRLTHEKNGQCMDIVYLDMKETEDMLDCVQVTCDDQATFVKAKGMIVYGGLVYVRDHPQDAVWIVFRLNNRCDLKVYTDKQKQLIEPKSRPLTLAQCKNVLERQQIDHLPQIYSNLKITPTNKKPFSESLADVQNLIAQQAAVSPTPIISPPPSGPLLPQPVGSPPPSAPLTPQPLGGAQTVSIKPAAVSNIASPPVLSQPLLPNKLVSSSPVSTAQTIQTPLPQVQSTTPLISSPLSNQPLPPTIVAAPPQIAQSAPSNAAPPSVYIVYSPPPPPPPPSPGFFGGIGSKIGGFFNKFGSPPPPTPTPPPPALVSTPSVPITATTSVPTAPASGTVITPVTVPISAAPIAVPPPPPPLAPAPAPTPAPAPPKKPWWHLF